MILFRCCKIFDVLLFYAQVPNVHHCFFIDTLLSKRVNSPHPGLYDQQQGVPHRHHDMRISLGQKGGLHMGYAMCDVIWVMVLVYGLSTSV